MRQLVRLYVDYLLTSTSKIHWWYQ